MFQTNQFKSNLLNLYKGSSINLTLDIHRPMGANVKGMLAPLAPW